MKKRYQLAQTNSKVIAFTNLKKFGGAEPSVSHIVEMTGKTVSDNAEKLKKAES